MKRISILCMIMLLVVVIGGCADGVIRDVSRMNTESNPVSIEEIWELEDEGEFVIEMHMYIVDKCNYGEDLDALSEPERIFYITQKLEMEINCGGFWQFFYNADDAVFCGAASAFSAIGAEKTAKLCREASAAFGQELPADRVKRMELLTAVGMEECYEILSDYDDRFLGYEEDLDALNYAYIQNNKDAFS